MRGNPDKRTSKNTVTLPPPLPDRRESRFPAIPILIAGILLLVLVLVLILLAKRISTGDSGGNNQEAANSGRKDDESSGTAKEQLPPAAEKHEASNDGTANADENSNNENKDGETKAVESPVADPGERPEDAKQGKESDDPPAASAEIAASSEEAEASTTESNVVGIGNISGGVAEFYGVKGSSGPISFIIDRSSSMDGERFNSARNQFLDSLSKLHESQSFNAYFYSEDFVTVGNGKLGGATKSRKRAYERLARAITPYGGTDPVPAVAEAVKSGTSCIFLLSDGEFYAHSAAAIISLCRSREIVVHTFSMEYDSQTLKEIASQCGGTYKLIR